MMTVPDFQKTVLSHYREHGRSFPWRETRDPYAITVSEFMLQQTQAERVIPKYSAFLHTLPSWGALAAVETTKLLQLWQGLGYNRRALNLKRLAQQISGKLPETEAELRELPGVGPYTASAIRAFAFNQPVVMIETNIRRAFLHHFFDDQAGISDRELFPLIEEALDRNQPREWYHALMDYGSWLAREYPNVNRRSKHYTKQSQFSGSLRQLRGQIVRLLTETPEGMVELLAQTTGQSPERVDQALAGLVKDGILTRAGNIVRIAD